MDLRLIRRFVADKLRDRAIYVLAAIVGAMINLYGQVLVPWFRGADGAVDALAAEFLIRPWLTVISIFLAFAFPFCVGVYSAVATRYKARRFESAADFPDRKPDPVFRARRSGEIVEVGAATRALFERFQVSRAQEILGDEFWRGIVSAEAPGSGGAVHFHAEGASYIVSHAPTNNGAFNIYLTKLPA